MSGLIGGHVGGPLVTGGGHICHLYLEYLGYAVKEVSYEGVNI